MTAATPVDVLRAKFSDQIQENVSLARYTSARVGGPADFLVTARAADELAAIVGVVWQSGMDCFVMGGGSNVLIGDKGVRGITILNRASAVRFEEGDQPKVWAESGVVFSNLANRCASKGFGGLEWAATVPGSVGGAIYGNAGAFGGDVAGSLTCAEVLTTSGRETWQVNDLAYGYRTSRLKRHETRAVVLSAEFRLKNATPAAVAAKIAEFTEDRKATQPPGASMGSMFKNPPGDHAGRLIEAAGLKGSRVGNAEISALHANFIINRGQTRASDIQHLIELARKTVREKCGVELELEIEVVGE